MTKRLWLYGMSALCAGLLLLSNCGGLPRWTATPLPPTAEPRPTSRGQPTGRTVPLPSPTAEPRPTSSPRVGGEEGNYPIQDIGEDTTWDDRPMAYLWTDLATTDRTDPAFEQQLRWGFGLLYERYPHVEVLEMQFAWADRYSLVLDAEVADWEKVAAGRLAWTAFWDRLGKEAMDLETGDFYEGKDVEQFLAELTGAVAGPAPTPTRPRLPTVRPTTVPVPTVRPTTVPVPTVRPTITPVVTPAGEVYEDPAGFFTLVYPQGWTPHRSRSEMQFWADAQGNAALAISIHIKAVSAQSKVDEIADFLAGKWDNYREVARHETTLSGYPAVWVEHTYRQGGVAQHGLLVGVVRNRVGFLLIAWAPEEDYAGLEAAFRSSIESLHLAEFPEAPPYDTWATYESAHIVFHYLPEAWVADEIAAIAADHEQAFADIVETLGVDYDGPIDFYLYTSEESFYRATARDAGFAINEASEVHSRWFAPDDHQSLGHEMTHVITYHSLGDPSEALLGEGIAVCLDHSGNDYHAIAADLLAQNALIPLSQMLGEAWGDYEYAYQVSGSFVCFLLDKYGMDRFKEIYPRSDFEAALGEIYGADLDTLDREWQEMLSSY